MAAPAFTLSLTFDLEQCTNFPYWSAVWDHRKGDLEPDVKRYVVRLVEVANEFKVKFQFFVLGSSLEHDDLEYLRQVIRGGHALASHSYRHINVKAKTLEQLQVVYRNDPALAARVTAQPAPTAFDVIRRELRDTREVVRNKLDLNLRGFRTPGGFSNGLHDAPEFRALLKQEGYSYVSSHYDFRAASTPRPSRETLEAALSSSLDHLQPYRYSDGLLEIPMMGLGDIGAFRLLDLERETWIQLLEYGLDRAREWGATYSILMHPCVLACRDSHLATVRRLLEKTLRLGGRVVTNDALAEEWKRKP